MHQAAQRIAVLGATGSIGRSCLDVIARHQGQYRASILAAGSDAAGLLALCRTFAPEHAVIADANAFVQLRDGLREAKLPTQAHHGDAALCQLVASAACDTVVAAIVGAAGLASTLAAARAGKRLLLANKESLVMAGDLLMQQVRAGNAQLIPIDSEHNAIFQCLPVTAQRHLHCDDSIHKVILTASGGPFRGKSRADLRNVSVAQAIAHPKWAMGRKISVDSASLMNKGLEVIEAHHLFGLARQRLDVWVHPQSLVHSLVQFVDGSTLAQLGLPDMRTSLALGLAWPARTPSGVAHLDLLTHGPLQFEAPDNDSFPCLRLAFAALDAGGCAPAQLNAANEVAVDAFLQGAIGFLAIPALIEMTMQQLPSLPAESLDAVQAADTQARQLAQQLIARVAQA